jgi:hypothetical protein
MPVTIVILGLPGFSKVDPTIQALSTVFAVLASQTPFDSAEDSQIPLSTSISGSPRPEFGGPCRIRKIIGEADSSGKPDWGHRSSKASGRRSVDEHKRR